MRLHYLLLIWVTLSDAFGRRPVMLMALLIFAIGAIVCAVSHDWTTMLAGRTDQGLGGGGLIALTTVLITDLVPLRDRGRFYALVSIVWAAGSATGPIIGGALAQSGSWRWIFWINLPIVGMGVVGIGLFLRLARRRHTLTEKLRMFDYPGSALFIASITALLIPITWGGVQYAWASWHTLVPLLLGAAGLVGFSLYELLVAARSRDVAISERRPLLIPPAVMSNWTVGILYAGSTFHGLILYSLVYYMPEYFQSVKGYSPVIAGVAALPQTVTIVPCAILVGVIVGITGRYRWAVWAGWLLTCFGMGFLILLESNTTVAQWIFLEAVSGLGIGLLFPSIALAIQSSVPQREVSVAATLVLFFRSMGQAIGVAVGGAILDNQLQRQISAASLLEDTSSSQSGLSLNAVTLVELLKHIPSDSSEAVEIRRALVDSFQVIWMVMCGFAGLNLILSIGVKEFDMNQNHETEQGFVHDTR
ncbi:MFS general substrate transporter [Aspergillus saccharolyticus JOP 1030-1]|uniref:MFS general substrate transporter n=1 Tax=Aspergillus saccharolyticus JOP 1030-1 TaxID=1450539 RepID=A0A319A1X3_9EURO|nr:MFS general substrate transporter [Aspergillus saccharolyticus JOP 1030-1]PYH41502.1 MFS general substrate transporter [Aspergillus saccharolyticus JOP 1030-1]